MNQNNSIDIAVWIKRGQDLLDETVKLFKKLQISTKELPKSIYDSEKPVSLVFVGQYSSGKSTILKALTGIKEIETGVKITTQNTHTYDWNGLKVVDTPGIHTTLRPDHDEISYEAISNADMLVYVVTHELFDSYIGQNFRKILIDKDKAGEMILIVNKMAAVGNSPENRKVKLEGLRIVTAPYSPEQLRICFIDAESYIDGRDEQDSEIAEELISESNYSELVSTINDFVREKSISSKLTTALYKAERVLQKAAADFQPSSGDEDVDALEEALLQERRIITSAQFKIRQLVKAIYHETAASIREKGRILANTLYDYNDEEAANDAIEAAYHEVEKMSDKCLEDVVAALEEITSGCAADLDDFYNSDFSTGLRFRLEEKRGSKNPLIEKLYKSDFLTQSGHNLVSASTGNSALSGLRGLSGSQMHDLVKKIGEIFKYKFKPWEALKWVEKIKHAGKILGALGVVFSLGMQIKEDCDAENHRQEMRSNRENLRACFNEAASGIVTHFDKLLTEFINLNYASKIEELDNSIEEIRGLRKGKSESCKMLEKVLAEYSKLIRTIHENDFNGR